MRTEHLHTIAILLIALFPVPTLHAQSTISMGLNHTRPLGDLQLAEYRNGFGFYMEVMSDSWETQLPLDLQVGGYFDVNVNGDERYDIDLLTPFAGPAEYSLTNQSITVAGKTRLITPAHHRVRLYADGIIGSRMFYATEAIIPEGDHEDFEGFDDCTGEVVQRSWTFLYGVSGGVMVRISPYARLDFRATYTRGSNAGFVDLNTVRPVEQNAFNYEIGRAATEMLQFQVGINFDIRNSSCGGSSFSDDGFFFSGSSCN